MSIRHNYIFEHYERAHDTDHVFPLPFNPKCDPQTVYISENGLHAFLAFTPYDDSPSDPFECGTEGEFYQFSSRSNKPDIDQFKRIIRANPGRVFTHSGTDNWHGPGTVACQVYAGPFDVSHTKCDADALQEQLDDARGYYIVPDDVTDPAAYARGALATYSEWCNGEVFGVCIWSYERSSISDEWEEKDRDECWGYYGDHAREEIDSLMAYYTGGGTL